MIALYYILVLLGTFVAMEGITWLTHKYIMHGILWSLHKDHHQKEPGFFEKNDAFFLIFAIPSWLLIMFGVIYQQFSLSLAVSILFSGFLALTFTPALCALLMKPGANHDSRLFRVVPG